MEEENRTTQDFIRMQMEYWRQVRESDGFDIENISLPSYMSGRITGLLPIDCQRFNRYPYKALVKQYANVGLHRYNMFKGTSFKFTALMKFNMLQNAVSSYYMTLRAQDPNSSTTGLETFQVRIDEQSFSTLDLACSIARLKYEVTTKKPFIPHFHGGAAADGIFKGELPYWPSDDTLNDNKRFYVLKESEWLATDWILMYLELVIYANDRSLTELMPGTNPLANLEIVKVAIETASEDGELPDERLNAKSAHLYITFKGMAEIRAVHRIFESGKHVERRAIVRRVIGKNTGYMTLEGTLCGGRYEEPPSWSKIKKRPRLR